MAPEVLHPAVTMDLGIAGRTALITGGAGRIGRATSLVLGEEGATVAVLDVDASGAKEVAREVKAAGGEAFAVACDLTDAEAVTAAVADAVDRAGGLDILVNNAGLVDARGRVESFPDELWHRDLAVNLTGTYHVTKAAFPRMKEAGWGRIVTLSSIAGWLGDFGQVSYSTTKAGLIGFGKSLALEGARHGITSNLLAPNVVVGMLADLSLEELEEVNPYFARLARATPVGHLGHEEDVANLIAYLVSQQAAYVTGQVIGVTGGVDLLTY